MINLGLLEAPLDVLVDVVSSESVNVSWSPPFTLDGIPILHYTVSVISQGILTEEINTTETHITLERPCASTTYQISGWNEVGEGNATLSGKNYSMCFFLFSFSDFTNSLVNSKYHCVVC